jgi:hypothetical protein
MTDVNPAVLGARLTIEIRDLTARVGRATQQLAQIAAIKPINDAHAAAIADMKANKEKQLTAAGVQLAAAQQALGALAPPAA